MLAKYDTSYLPRTKTYSVLLSSVHLRSASLQLSRWEKDWSLVYLGVKVKMNRRISSKMFDLEVVES